MLSGSRLPESRATMGGDSARVWRAVEAVERKLDEHELTQGLKPQTKIRLAAECATAALHAYAADNGTEDTDGDR